ncbi:ATP-binding protein [Corynebacterium diphtheriae]|uniref:Orc1-like AAA ATPase domain-containing protein n=2 Tax=Corynebacterium diphtheriae TaxID=1717 RepID=Q6NFX2_CORDI|nr:ATP-binding protein [Corynebacterium diphtheriae]ARB87861.1 ATP-binding protein [Corynebacterium diphtheriae]MBG9228146.1 ATP-binding protein [Corynebacterium diphtheriae bv. gravis]MBG9247619.1 ATP-binding protein [Corynebacterium diphtheriae bv. gravis]MBG9250009.1 ATP-binding protein [Corynebacterium diphtheriae bv. mitis]MBG9253884.1 ATP-binding protein [Corynebacterium diphtheriae bv. mitis]
MLLSMNRVSNPFRATLGSTPPYLAGRRHEIEDFAEALDDGPGAHERISLITGLRGVGKTVLLNAFEEEARARSWWVISETATAGFTERIIDALFRKASEILHTHRRKLSGITLPSIGGIQFSDILEHQPKITLRSVLTEILSWQEEIDRKLGQDSVGLLITLDELHYHRREEVIDFGATIQHLVREDLNISVAMAGIPQSIKPLLASEEGKNPVTFLRRANRIDLGLIDNNEVRKALAEPVEKVGVTWESDALTDAAEACGGYPFMIQLIGQQCFKRKRSNFITVGSVAEAAVVAKRKLGQLVHEPALADLSEVDRTFLVAMAADDGPSTMSDIAQRLGVNSQYAGNYRRRLIDAEIITSSGYGQVDFELPYMREYLREHAVVDVFKQ